MNDNTLYVLTECITLPNGQYILAHKYKNIIKLQLIFFYDFELIV